VLHRKLRLDAAVTQVRDLLETGDGIDLARARPPCSDPPPPTAMDGSRQRTLTLLAATAFLESRFAPTAAERTRARAYLAATLPREEPDVSVRTAAR
jgi:hypothetical protein